ncbi:hypothetical protein CYK67_07735 [Clostridium perfringens]|nr:hypothetical protein CYK67_07735 [Clostridium perfringens]
MKNIEIYNTLNIDKDSSSIVATFTQEDDAVMEFKLFKDGQEIVLKDQTISLGAERKDGAVIEQDDGFLIKENNVLNITLKKNIIQVVGVVKIQLYLKDKSGEMASNTFNIRVNKKLLGAENVEATNDIKSLNTLVLELKNNTNKLIDDTKAKADKLLNGLQETGNNLSDTVKAKTDKVIEDTKAEVDNIKKDYEGLKKVVIDENIGIKLQKDVTELQNGLKSNQALAYSGSSISAENTLEGRTEGMKIKGRTIQNVFPPVLTKNYSFQGEGDIEGNALILPFGVDVNATAIRCIKGKALIKPNQTYTVIVNILSNNTNNNLGMSSYLSALIPEKNSFDNRLGISKMKCTSRNLDEIYNCDAFFCIWGNGGDRSTNIKFTAMLLEGDWTNKKAPEYFEEIKSFGEAEQEGDKYKISILSTGKNLMNPKKLNESVKIKGNEITFTASSNAINEFKGNEKTQYTFSCSAKKNSPSSAIESTHTSLTIFYTDGTSQRIRLVSEGEPIDVYKNIKVVSEPSKTIKGFSVWGYDNTSTLSDFMIEEGTQVTSFEPYKYDKKDILIKEPLKENDIIYEEDGQIKIFRNTKQYTFTGDEENILINMSYSTESMAVFSIVSDVFNDKKEVSSQYDAISLFCNNFLCGSWFDVYSSKVSKEMIAASADNNSVIYFKILKSKLSSQDVEGFKAWLKANPTTVVYQLATPVTEIVENCVDIDLDTYQEKHTLIY